MSTIILAIILGAAFGFTLDRVGATNPGYIIKMLNLTDFHLMKTIVLGVGFASVLLFGGLMLGIVDPAHLSIKATYIGVLIGGILLGTGFAIAGYCPGTGLTAAATGRKDAMFFVLGGFLGAGLYMITYEWIASTGILNSVLEGKATLATIEQTTYPALFDSLNGRVTGIVMGVFMLTVALIIPSKIRNNQ